ncbi:MAG: DinB family protein [Actinobacteria bacterium]|nr:DinB family protein [Actinomycetota bacterium]
MPSVVDSLRATVPALVSFVTGSRPDTFQRRPAPNEWNAATVIAHMADAELVYAVRIRSVLTQPGGLLPAFDEGKWADRFGPLDDELAGALARFRVLRQSTIAVVESLADEEWERSGLHEQYGELTVRQLVNRLVAHDATHLDQIRAALGA